jgi:hypothetical protein
MGAAPAPQDERSRQERDIGHEDAKLAEGSFPHSVGIEPEEDRKGQRLPQAFRDVPCVAVARWQAHGRAEDFVEKREQRVVVFGPPRAGEDRHAAEDAEAEGEGEAEAAARRPGGDEEGGTKADGEDDRGSLRPAPAPRTSPAAAVRAKDDRMGSVNIVDADAATISAAPITARLTVVPIRVRWPPPKTPRPATTAAKPERCPGDGATMSTRSKANRSTKFSPCTVPSRKPTAFAGNACASR